MLSYQQPQPYVVWNTAAKIQFCRLLNSDKLQSLCNAAPLKTQTEAQNSKI